jgi:uncharacterized membrane protein
MRATSWQRYACGWINLIIVLFVSVGLYVTITTATTAINSAVPLLFELSCELAYPIGEGSAAGVLTLISNFCGLLFLAVFSFPNIGKFSSYKF